MNAKGNKIKKRIPLPGGAPEKYKPEFAEKVYDMALLGLKDESIAKLFGIAESTLNLWKHEHPELLEALTRGREVADAEVTKAMYKRALGVTIVEEALTKDGEVVKLRKELPPDTPAAKHWLANRQRGLWSNNGESQITTTEPLVIVRTETKDKDA
jgi:hypothetical protein